MYYHIAGLDNRGTDVCPFGRVYLSTKKDGDVMGSVGYGSHKDDPDPYAIWPTSDTPDLGDDPTLVVRIKEVLRKEFPKARKDLG